MFVPSGNVIRTGGILFASSGGESINIERKSKSFPHFLGFLALAALPVCLSITAYTRSPTSPRSVMYEEFSSSPSIDFTGYRHKETTVPAAPAGDCWFINSYHHPSSKINFRLQLSIYGLCTKWSLS